MSQRGEPYRVRARNTATASANKIHDDDVARRYGFSGGLVPGVEVFAYLVHPIVEHYGDEWVASGTVRARFLHPVYDGGWVTVDTEPEPDGNGIALVVRDERGTDCALAIARTGSNRAEPDIAAYPTAPLPDPKPAASPSVLARLAPMGSIASTFDARLAADYLDQIGEPASVFRAGRIAHPGWLLRRANRILMENVTLGPWIHVESEVELRGVVHDGDIVTTRGHVRRVWDAKGHRFVTLDVLVVANEERPVLRAEHTAIYEPRARQ